MRAYSPHNQLKTIRKRLGITQMRAAAMLGVSYPYLLSVETGQRALSRALARKIEITFGVVGIQDKNAEPMMVDLPRDDSEDIFNLGRDPGYVPFTKERFEKYASADWPVYYLEGDDQVVRPMPSDYARCTEALLSAVAEQHMLLPVITDLISWFAKSITSDAILDSFKRKFDQLFPGQRKKNDAFLALTFYLGKRVEDKNSRHQERLAAAAKRAVKKRRKQRKKLSR